MIEITEYNAEKRHREILDDIHETYLKKNHDYGDSFHDSVEEFGLVSAATRMSDKWNRFKNYVKGEKMQVSDESAKDTLLDLANYCIMTAMEIERKGI